MTVPAPFPVKPGDKLRVTSDKPDGTDLLIGDLVTVLDVGIHITNGVPVPVVQVSTAHGTQMLTFGSVERISVPSYTPAKSDDVVDAFFFRILGHDADLRSWAVKVKSDLSANDPKPGQPPAVTAVQEGPTRSQVGQAYSFTDQDDDTLEVTYWEADTGPRYAGFHFEMAGDEAVFIPATDIDGLIRYLFAMRRHSQRPGE